MNEVFAGLPVSFVELGLNKDDEIQLRMLFGNISRQLNNLLIKRGVDPSSVKIYVTTGAPAELQEKTVNPTTTSQIVSPNSGYDGLSKVTVNAIKLQEKTASPATTSQVISPDTGKDGLSKVTVSAVTAAIDENIVAGNIKSGVTILGVTGTYEGPESESGET